MVGIWNAFKISYDSETAWRLSFLVPASIVLLVAIGQFFLADDCPKGNYKELEAHGAMVRKKSSESFKKASICPIASTVSPFRLPSGSVNAHNNLLPLLIIDTRRKTDRRNIFGITSHPQKQAENSVIYLDFSCIVCCGATSNVFLGRSGAFKMF